MKTLVVEDDPKTAAYLKTGLCAAGFTVDVAGDGDEALELLADRDYSILVLDVMLPRRDGWSVLSEIRGRDPQLPVVMLTARDGTENRVRGLELGADD